MSWLERAKKNILILQQSKVQSENDELLRKQNFERMISEVPQLLEDVNRELFQGIGSLKEWRECSSKPHFHITKANSWHTSSRHAHITQQKECGLVIPHLGTVKVYYAIGHTEGGFPEGHPHRTNIVAQPKDFDGLSWGQPQTIRPPYAISIDGHLAKDINPEEYAYGTTQCSYPWAFGYSEPGDEDVYDQRTFEKIKPVTLYNFIYPEPKFDHFLANIQYELARQTVYVASGKLSQQQLPY